MARLTILLLLLVLMAPPAAAVAQDNPFGPIPQAPPQQTEPPDDGLPNRNEDDGLSRRQQLLIALAGVTLLFGIGYAIVRDARNAAPADVRTPIDEGGSKSRGTRPPKQKRVAQGRAKAKVARQSRKRNR